MHIPDGYAAYCFDEVCEYVIGQLGEGKRPFFERMNCKGGAKEPRPSGNAATVDILKKLGAEVRTID